ncbi:hypothetical protein [Flavobacterium subsaxonicum]|uniref:DUF4136 domain-containing protein n=1 Tax=Flavobacterium subsaxonicum WB 4.1-42 = DSM 21790 TaxID=1121898 RepID=A0A0A2MFM5_9FLAO|nr:hypothetical protein [Flavobacterium subsaxonicum]KGO91497.1 hypothetical protein Q766_17355 [Flavobacterium subsaxonicum WB 4.1-42 = DSM 21790]
MKKLLLLIFCAFIGQITVAQTKPEYYLISLTDEATSAMEVPFYIEEVYDGRQFTDNIGTVQKGIANRKVLSRFEKPFLTEVKDYLLKAYPKMDGRVPVSVRVNDLYISEYTEKSEETGFASAVIDVIVKKDGVNYIVGTYGGNIESTGMDVTAKHPDRIRRALNKCLGKYEVTPEEDKTYIVFDNTPVEKRELGKPAKGIYGTYLDMIKNTPKDDSNFYVSSKNNKYYLINNTNSQKADDYYAFSDGETVYLNVSKFAGEKYYAKTERIADKFFIEHIAYDQNRMITQIVMYQLGGIYVPKIDTTMPMLIDCYSGQPFFLSNNDIKTLLAPRPDLLKEYKDSKKTAADIKNVIIKYYSKPSK